VRVCLDAKGQVVFFTPRGKALLGAAPAGVRAGAGGGLGEDGHPAKPRLPGLKPSAGAPRWKRDADIPWAIEARAWEALDSG
jgi:hypothetical protein